MKISPAQENCSSYKLTLLIILLLSYGQCTKNDPSPSAQTQNEDNNIIPGQVVNTLTGRVGETTNFTTPVIKDQLDRDVVPTISLGTKNLVEIASPATAASDQTRLKFIKAGTDQITVTWQSADGSQNRDINNDGVEDQINYAGQTATATVNLIVNTDQVAPTKPVLKTPANTSTADSTSPLLAWQASIDANNDVITYVVKLDTLNPPVQEVFTSSIPSQTSYRVTTKLLRKTYYWQVTAKDATSQNASLIWSFQVPNTAPTVPNLTSPNNNSTDISVNSSLTWQASTDVDGDRVVYDIFLDTKNPPVIKVSSGQNNLAYTSSGQTKNTQYYWQVVAKDEQGAEVKSLIWTYTTSSNASPTRVNLLAPANNADNIPLNTSLTWQASTDADGDAVIYDIFLDTNNPPTNRVATNQTGLTYVPTGQISSTKYYWTIVAKDNKGGASVSALRSYTTASRPPSQPSLTSPANSAVGVAPNTKLVWKASSDPDNDAIVYDVFLDTDNPPTTRVSTDQEGLTYTPNSQTSSTKYYWTIVAKDNKGGASVSALRSYTTASRPPSQPSLTSPANSAVGVAPNTKLVWKASSDPDNDAIVYDVFLREGDNSFEDGDKVSTGQSGTEYTPTGQKFGKTYFWKVIARDGKGGKSSSNSLRGYTTNYLPTTPTLIIPKADSTGIALNSVLVWNRSTDINARQSLTYDIYLGTANPPTTKVSTGQSDTTYTPTGQALQTTYYWHVVVKDGAGGERRSPIRKYTTTRWEQVNAKADWISRSFHASVVFQNKMWVIGGFNSASAGPFLGLLDDVWSSNNGINWTRESSNSSWSGRSGHTAVVLKDSIFILGGSRTTGGQNDVWVSGDGKTWIEKTNSAPWAARFFHTSLVYDDKIWIMGGRDIHGKKRNDVWWSADGSAWTEATDSADWSKRELLLSVVFNSKMWVLTGNLDDDSKEDDVWSSTDGVNWTQVTADINAPGITNSAAVAYNNQILIIAGSNQNRNTYSSTDGSTWTQSSRIPSTSFHQLNAHTSVVFDGKVWVLGGQNEKAESLNEVWRFR